MAWFERLHVGAHIPSGVVGGPLNSRPLPMKHLVICILSLAGSNPPQLIHAIRSRVRHLAPRCVARLAVAQWQKGESPTCKCGDWCFLSWRLQCGSYQDLLIPTLGLRSPFLVLNFLIRRTSADDDENDCDGDNLKREQWKSGCLRLLIHRVSLGLVVLILSPLKTFPFFSFFLWQEQLQETPSGSQLYESLIVVIFVFLIIPSLIPFVSHCCTCACWR